VITGDQIAAHLVGDYILQSHWMASEKTKRSLAAAVHAVTYALPFLFLTRNPAVLAVIIGTHFAIDRWRLARFVVWIKNGTWLRPFFGRDIADAGFLPDPITATGYPESSPAWLAVWLLIIADNTIHILINGAALALFGGH
jgi:hypothetical protein